MLNTSHLSFCSLLTADKSIKYIKNQKLKDSSAKDLSIISKNLYDISSENQSNQINIQVNIPTDRTQLIDMIMDNGKETIVATPIVEDKK